MIKRFKTLTLFSKIMFFICLGLFVTSIVLICLQNVMNTSDGQLSRLYFNAFQSFLMMVLILLPLFIRKMTHLVIPWPIEVIYLIFCSLCLILGEIGEFYNKVSWWDSMLHTLSGVLIGALGYIFINTIDKSEKNKIELTPIFSSILVLIFVMSVGYVWELFEWCSDQFFGTNMQRYLVEGSTTIGGGEPLVGHAALGDTMKDMFLNLIGGLIVAIYGFFQLKHDKKGITSLALAKDDEVIETNKVKVEDIKTE